MALVKLSNEIVLIRGRFGGVYFKPGPDGQHIQAMPRVRSYHHSALQQGKWEAHSPFLGFGIDGWSGASALWLMALLAAFGAAWAAFALANLFTTKHGDKKHITGYNWFMHYALAFPECERPPYWKPPHAIGELPNFQVLYKGFWSYGVDPTEWPADCCSDTYWEFTTYNGKPAYLGDDVKWWLWWKDPMWVISPGLGLEPEEFTFYRSELENHGKICGYYRNPVTKKWASNYWGRPEERYLPH